MPWISHTVAEAAWSRMTQDHAALSSADPLGEIQFAIEGTKNKGSSLIFNKGF
jgi:hypothetical protein